MNRHTVRTLGVIALLGLLPAVAFAGQVEGEWQGSIDSGNKSAGVEAFFRNRSAEFRFTGGPSCSVKADYIKADGRALIYTFSLSNNGGKFCDNLLGQSLEITHVAGEESMTISFGSPGNIWRGTLNQPTHR